ncbi:MAG: hypothetical protein ACJAS1_000526 [Oleiphilaceae bacterium]
MLEPKVWHFHREDDASRYISIYEHGIANTLQMFALHRKGKTALLMHDIRPLAYDKGFNVIYCSFDNGKDKPSHSLLAAIEKATLPIVLTDYTKGILSTPVKGNSLVMSDISVSVKLDEKNDTDSEVINKLKTAFDEIAQNKKRTIILLDDIQALVGSKNVRPLLKFVSSTLDEYPSKLCYLYASSSRDALTGLFNDRESPLYDSSQQYKLPNMGDEFLLFLSRRFKQATNKDIALDKIKAVWVNVSYSPYHLLNIVELMITTIEHDIEAATNIYMQNLHCDPANEAKIARLSKTDRSVIKAINSGESSLFSSKVMKGVIFKDGVNNEKKNLKDRQRASVQRSLKKLRNYGLISKIDQKTYEIESPDLMYLLRKVKE